MAEINAQNVVQEFKTDDWKAIVQAYPLGNLQYREFFPLEFNTGLDYTRLEKAAGAKVMADVVALGSRAIRKGRDFVEKSMGQITKKEIARDKDEYDMFKIRDLRTAALAYPNNSSVKNQMINMIYDDVPFVIDGINARLEFEAKQLASTGKVTTIASNNEGVKNISLDYGVTVQNAQKDWFADATADPIEELQALQDAARATGNRYMSVTLETDTLNKVLRNQNTKMFVLGIPVSESTVLPSVTLAQLNTELQLKGLPVFKVWDSFVQTENKAGERTAVSGWVQGNITLTISPIIGVTKYTVSDEFNIKTGIEISKEVKDDFLLVKTWGTEDPQIMSTKGTAFAIPVFNDVKKSLILKTKLA